MDYLRALRVLGLPPGASSEDIHAAWRDLAKVWHPDRFTHDERLRQKAGENLSRINQAYDTLEDYDPAKTPGVASRVRESVAIILGLGELGEPPPPAPGVEPVVVQPAIPRGPIGLRQSLRVLGLGRQRMTGEAGTRHTSRRGVLVLTAGLVIAVLLLFLFGRR